MSDEPFGRQPKPVTVRLDGEATDTQYWALELARRAEFKGDSVQHIKVGIGCMFVIHPRAVND